MKNINILLYEDHQDYRLHLVELLRGEPDFQVVGAYPDCRLLREQVEALRPDLVLFDIEMPYVDGVQGLYLLKQHFPSIPALMLTIFDDDDKVFNAVCLGADGYLLKNTPPERLFPAIREVFDGGAPMTPTIARKVLRLYTRTGFKPALKYDLTEKERAVLGHLVDGHSYKMVASEMGVSINTVRTHITGVYAKLQVHSVSEAVVKAIREQIL